MSGYRVFARYYDALTQNIDYGRRAEYFDALIRRHGVFGKKPLLLDLACGTGSLSVALAGLGYEVVGTDGSMEMLSTAMQKSVDLPEPILFLHQSMSKLDLYGSVSVTICALDSLNHLSGEKELEQVIARVSTFTDPGGLFIFDVNTIYKHKCILANHAFVYELDHLFCVWQNTSHPSDHRVEIQLDFFESSGDGSYRRTEERFSERVFQEQTLETALQNHNFTVLAVYGDDSLEQPTNTTQRLVYVAQKVR